MPWHLGWQVVSYGPNGFNYSSEKRSASLLEDWIFFMALFCTPWKPSVVMYSVRPWSRSGFSPSWKKTVCSVRGHRSVVTVTNCYHVIQCDNWFSHSNIVTLCNIPRCLCFHDMSSNVKKVNLAARPCWFLGEQALDPDREPPTANALRKNMQTRWKLRISWTRLQSWLDFLWFLHPIGIFCGSMEFLHSRLSTLEQTGLLSQVESPSTEI